MAHLLGQLVNSQEVIFQITIDREALATQEASEAFIRRHSFGEDGHLKQPLLSSAKLGTMLASSRVAWDFACDGFTNLLCGEFVNPQKMMVEVPLNTGLGVAKKQLKV